MNQKISVIVPVYNVKDYLEACVKSIVSQTYQNLEIILVDDGATDGCSELCDEIAKTDERIMVVHKENGGLSDARNAGMDVATGDYIGFVDSDDAIEPDMFELLINNLLNYNADISCCRYTRVWEDGQEENVGDDGEIRVYNGLDALKEYIYGKTMDPFVWNKLYKSELINHPNGEKRRFIKGVLGEDNPFNIEMLKTVNKVVLAEESKYRYLQKRPGAITNSAVSQKKIDSVYFWDGVRKDCEANYPELVPYALRRQALFYIGLYNMVSNQKSYESEKKTVRNFLKEQNSNIQKSDICERVLKLSSILIVYAPWLYNIAMKLYKKVIGEAKL